MTVGASRSAASSAARAKRGRKRVSRTRRPTRAYSSPACSLHEIESERRGGDRVDVQIKRIYEKPSRSDGFRVLVDRVWPRGVAKEAAAIDAWARELAPSTALRKWFGHDPKRWEAFRERYRKELAQHEAEIEALRQRARRQRVTLLYGARDERFNQAVVLAELLREG